MRFLVGAQHSLVHCTVPRHPIPHLTLILANTKKDAVDVRSAQGKSQNYKIDPQSRRLQGKFPVQWG